MHEREDDLKQGVRIRLTPLGIERCPRLKSHTGIIVGTAKRGNAFRVLIDGRKVPLMLHESYVEAE